jgi:hypothetical protein
MLRRCLIPFLFAAACPAAAAPTALAAFFPGDIVDGGPAVSSVQGADLATDGTGAIAYLRSDGGADHLFVARVVGGAVVAPQRVDAGVADAATKAGVVATDKGRLTVAWVAGGRLLVSVRAPGATAWPAPTPLVDDRAAGRSVTDVSVDTSINGVPYIVYTEEGGGQSADVRVARFYQGRWIVEPTPLDLVPGANAGQGSVRRPQVSANAEGSALAVWGEDGADGRTHVYARRITRKGVATTIREVSVPSLDGRPGGNADSAQVAMEYDSSYGWVAFRQAFADTGGTRYRVLARRLAGSDFGAPVAIDGLGFPALESGTAPRIDIDGRGRGLATSTRDASHQVVSTLLRTPPLDDVQQGGRSSEEIFQPPLRLDSIANAEQPFVTPAAAENGRAFVAWAQSPGPGLASSIAARGYISNVWEPAVALSRPELGGTAADQGLAVASDRAGDAIVAFVQGAPGARKLVVAAYDRPPGRARPIASTRWTRSKRPKLKWETAFEVWGAPTYQVVLNGVVVATTPRASLRPATDVPDGVYPWKVVSVDRRGQPAEGSNRLLRVDSTPPTGLVSSVRTGSPGRMLRVGVTPRDLLGLPPGGVPPVGSPPALGSGVVKVSIAYGDGTRPFVRQSRRVLAKVRSEHVYRRAGSYTITVRLYDQAGNVGVLKRMVSIRRGGAEG